MRWNTQDTIAAIATAPGAAGLAVVRVSGPSALACADRVFRGRAPLSHAESHTLHHGWAHWPGDADRRLDEVVAALFRAPRSYTRDDVVEISCHGGTLPARRVLDALIAAGARLAHGGEFTLRAFLNGRLDLAQAEAVADLIAAETEAARERAVAQLGGELSRGLRALGERIADAVAEVEARVDFAEDVGGVEVPPHVVQAVRSVYDDLGALLDGAAYARAVREGVRVPIVGRPNVGKSSLFNALVGEERAIVTPIPGTTRDRVSESVELAGVRVVLSDTAGLRSGLDVVERIGVARARAALAESPIALWTVDGSAPLEPDDHAVAGSLAGKRVLIALNKSDLPGRVEAREVGALVPGGPRVVAASARTGAGVGELREALADLLGASQAGAPGEIVALELREGMAALGEVTGQSVSEDLLERIFSRFCVGK